MSSSTNHHRRPPVAFHRTHRGFTLIELLVAIAIIGILVSLLLVAGRGVLIRAREFAVTAEIRQMEQALESFKTKYGFYPPSTITEAGMTRILARIAPNHRETNISGWYTEVGQYLDEQSSLVFWLSGLAESKQYPLTGDGTAPLDGFNTGTDFARETFYEFQTAQLVAPEVDPGPASNRVRAYKMPHGNGTGSLNYRYIDASSYGNTFAFDIRAYLLNDVAINPNSFQLFCAGIDGDFDLGDDGNVNNQRVKALDNLVNFGGGGSLEVFISNN